MDTAQKGTPRKQYLGKARGVHKVTQHAVGTVVNNQGKSEILAKRINVCIEYTQPSKSQDGFLKHMKENNQRRKEAKQKGI